MARRTTRAVCSRLDFDNPISPWLDETASFCKYLLESRMRPERRMSGSARGDEKPSALRRNWRSSPTLPFYASVRVLLRREADRGFRAGRQPLRRITPASAAAGFPSRKADRRRPRDCHHSFSADGAASSARAPAVSSTAAPAATPGHFQQQPPGNLDRLRPCSRV